MTDRRARVMMVGLILAFPWLITALGSTGWTVSSVRTTLLVESVLVGGLVTAAHERTRLLAERSAATTPAQPARAGAPSLPHLRPAQAPVARRRLRAGISLFSR